MNDDNILATTAARVFDDLAPLATRSAAADDTWQAELWQTLEEHGMTLAAVPEHLGGAGATLSDAFTLLTVAGRHSAPAPLAETFLAGWLLSTAHMQVPRGPLSIVAADKHTELVLRPHGQGWQLRGYARRVPWARHAEHLVLLATGDSRDYVVCVPRSACAVVHGDNLAGEPRDDVRFDDVVLRDLQVVPAGHGIDHDALKLMGACARACQMAGALDRVLDLALRYVSERVQFGRALAKFQAIQHQLATLAGEAAAAAVAADSAAIAIEALGPALAAFDIAAAKIRCGAAAGSGAAIAHQVHGAMGFTEEYPLHHATRRLWSWRDDFGNEAYWAERLGAQVCVRGGDALWLSLSSPGDVTARSSAPA